MKKVLGKISALLFICSLMVIACNKDYSVESPHVLEIISPATGSCLGITANGDYYKKIALNSDNFLAVDVNFTNYGTYQLHTDTVNGCWFASDSSYANATGIGTIILKGYGTPIDSITTVFHIYFQKTSCFTTIKFLPTPHISAETDYFPMTLGTNWTDDSVMTNPSEKDTIRYTVSPIKKTVGSYTYTRFSSSFKDSKYYRKDGAGNYYELNEDFTFYGISGFDYKFLDDKLPVKSTWQTPPIYGAYKPDANQSLPFKLIIKCTIVEKNIKYKLTNINKTIDSVIHVQLEYLATSPDGQSNFSDLLGLTPADTYYAKKKGLIYYNIDNTLFHAFRQVRSWNIQ